MSRIAPLNVRPSATEVDVSGSSPQSIRRLVLLAGIVGMLVGVAGCATTETVPTILSNTVVNGKGVPNGRSDSQAPFAVLVSTAADPAFGRKPATAIKVGTGNIRAGDRQERLYLNALRGPAGEVLDYERLGACCQFATTNGTQGVGFLDVFRVSGLPGNKVVLLYLNMYDPGPAELPQGLTARVAP